MAGILDYYPPGYFDKHNAYLNRLGVSVMNPGSDSIDLWNRLQNLEARITILENPDKPDLANYAELLNQQLQETRAALKEEVKKRSELETHLTRLIDVSRAFLRCHNPLQLSSDAEQQWLNVMDQCHFAEDALKRVQKS